MVKICPSRSPRKETSEKRPVRQLLRSSAALLALFGMLFSTSPLLAKSPRAKRERTEKHQAKAGKANKAKSSAKENVRERHPASRRDRAQEQTRRRVQEPTRSRAKEPARRRAQETARRRAQEAAQRRAQELARQRAEAARLAAERQRALDNELRDSVQSMIAKDDVGGEDLEVRRVAIEALGNHAGTVVVMDPKTGRIYTIVNQQWALQTGFKPCSTIKLVTGLAGLNEKVIDSTDTTISAGAGNLNLTSALAHSNNPYFQTVGGRVGFDKMVSYARQLGFGEKTGINLPNETRGRLPESKSGFAVNHMSSHGDDFKVTALQLATLVSAMANGGTLVSPHVPRTPQEETKFKTKVRRLIDLDGTAWQSMVPGMAGAVKYGTARRAYNPSETIVGKTGTCIEGGSWIGLFASYAPLSNPNLAVVVIARGSDGRNHFPVAVAGKIYRELGARFGTGNNTMQIAAEPASRIMNAKTADDTSAAGDDEDSADSDADALTTTNPPRSIPLRDSWGTMSTPANSKVKPTVMPVPKRNQ